MINIFFYICLNQKIIIMKDFLERLGNLKTTFTGVIGAILTILVILGKITETKGDELVPIFDSVWEGIMAAISAVVSIYLLFAKDKLPGAKTFDLGDKLGAITPKILGIAGFVITLLALFGVLGKDEADGAVGLIGSAWEGILAAITGVLSIIAFFSKDS